MINRATIPTNNMNNKRKSKNIQDKTKINHKKKKSKKEL